MEILKENNTIKIRGTVVSDVELSHEVFEERYYKFFIETKRLSEMNDVLPVIVSEKLIDINTISQGDIVYIDGQIRSHNFPVKNRKSRLVLSIFAKHINIENYEDDTSLNEVRFQGYICKKPIYRMTPLGREITDVLIAINRAYKKSDYIPCILWGRNAKFCEGLPIGSKVNIVGRMQSRNYSKKISEDETVDMVAYEVSTSIFNLTREEEKEEEFTELETAEV